MRIKRGIIKNRKHNKVLKATKGYRQSYHRLYKRAKEAMLHAGQYSYAHRRRRRSDKRNEWIKVIAAALSRSDVGYNVFVHGLATKNIELDRKVLAEIAIQSPAHFSQIVASATK